MNKFLFLDFDGVLFDTVDEAYEVCINTKMFKNNTFTQDSLNVFRKNRYLVGPAWNYYYIMQSLMSENVINHTEFILTDEVKSFEIDFFNTRKQLKLDYKNWLMLNKPYDFLFKLEKIISYAKELNVYIITTKDKQTVIDLLNSYNINCIKYENILGKDMFDNFLSKHNIIKHILLENTDEYDAIFIDDLYEHLVGCKNIESLELLQPNWGYINAHSKLQYLCNIEQILEKIHLLIGKTDE